VFWTLNWTLTGLRSHWGFFPLWLGYILVVDASVRFRSGSSLLNRNLPAFLGLFLVSAPCWWLFELLNQKAQYWIYTGRSQFTDLEYFLWASLSFSTVIPAVFETAELVSTVPSIKKARWFRVPDKGLVPYVFFGLGSVLLVSFLIKPEYGAAFLWMSLYLILDPINLWMGNRSILHYVTQKNWGTVFALGISSLICGFFWEMWNYFSDPKWFYQIPHVNFWHVFEMPLVGYLGYLPFSLELFAVYHFVVESLSAKKLGAYLHI